MFDKSLKMDVIFMVYFYRVQDGANNKRELLIRNRKSSIHVLYFLFSPTNDVAAT